MTLKFSSDFPNRAPQVKFDQKMFHPNVYPDGQVCLSLLDRDWRPTLNVKNILMGVQCLLTEPNPRSPANGPAYQMFTKDKKGYEAKVRKEALKYAEKN